MTSILTVLFLKAFISLSFSLQNFALEPGQILFLPDIIHQISQSTITYIYYSCICTWRRLIGPTSRVLWQNGTVLLLKPQQKLPSASTLEATTQRDPGSRLCFCAKWGMVFQGYFWILRGDQNQNQAVLSSLTVWPLDWEEIWAQDWEPFQKNMV